MSSSPEFPRFAFDAHRSSSYNINSRIMVAAVIVLFLVIIFILGLHIYAKRFWRQSAALVARRHASWRRRHRFEFAEQDGIRISGTTGLDKAAIDSLPVFTYLAPQSKGNALECAVCLCEFQTNEKGRLLPKCKHSFHNECIDMWFHSHSTCPLCRASAVPDFASVDLQPTPESSPESSFGVLGNLDSSPNVDSSELSTDANQGLEAASLTSSGGDRRRLISDISLQNQGVQYPTNVLFWGDHTHVSSRLSSPRLEQGQADGSSLPHIILEIPRRPESFPSPHSSSASLGRRETTLSPRCSFAEGQPCSPNGQSQKLPVARLKTFKRLLSRERKAFSTHQDGDCDQGGTVLNIS
eukprot:c25243_g1_i2 orf=333-1394(-)